MNEKPIVLDLFCGLGGWSEVFIAEGYRAVGFDIEAHNYGDGGYPGELVLRDVRSICGADLVKQYGVPAVIVCSPPCQEFSYMAMPWSKAKQKQARIEADPAERVRLTDLFKQCFRIQREVSEAAGHYIPLIVENVCGAQRWVGKARWHFGSFYLWGDVPALMPIPGKAFFRPTNNPRPKLGLSPGQQVEGSKGFRKNSRFNRATGKVIAGGIGDASDYSSKSSARKRASAEIAKIPPTLAAWIARTFRPK